MIFENLYGKPRKVSISRYKVDWDATCRSKIQKAVKDYLRTYWQHKVVCEEFRIPSTLLKIDLINITDRIVVETNGEQHDELNEFFHGGNRAIYLGQIKRDHKKYKWCEMNRFQFVEIYEKDFPLSRKFFLEKFNINL